MKIKKYKNLKEYVKLTEEAVEDIENPQVEAAADAVNADEVITPEENKGEIWNTLQRSKTVALRKKALEKKRGKKVGDFPNVLFIGGAGIGKTAMIEDWADNNDVNLFTLQGSSLDAADMGGLPMIDKGDGTKAIRAQKVGTGILDQLDRPNSVLFLDELNRARQDVRAALLQLINQHIVQDFTEDGGMRRFPNFLFTVAAINPSGKAGYQTYELDSAEKGRFENIELKVENDVFMNYLVPHYTEEAADLEELGDHEGALEAERKAALAKKLLTSASFDFDTMESEEEAQEDDSWNGLTTSPRNLTLLLDSCDGTKDDFIKKWSTHCNNLHLANVKIALANYTDIADKANDALAGGTRSNLFNKRQASGLAKMRQKYGNV